MAQLGGKSVRTLVTSLEILSDDGTVVLMLDSMDGLGGGGVKIRTRKPWESTWSGSLPMWSIAPRDAEIVSKIVANSDAQYNRASLDAIDSSDFRGENPDTADEAKIEAAVEARCSQLDIERAKAANLIEEKVLLAQQLVVQHYDGKHDRDVDGCVPCEDRTRSVTLGADMPWDAPATHGTYDPDDDSTKTAEQGYGDPLFDENSPEF
jgi:hypothetical protein